MISNISPDGGSPTLPPHERTFESVDSIMEKTNEKAALILQKAWKKHKGPKINSVKRSSIKPIERKSAWKETRSMIFGPIVMGPHGPKHEIPMATIEKVIDRLVQAQDREGLRRLANILFTGPIPYRTMCSMQRDKPSVQALIYLLVDNKSDLQLVKKLMIEGVKEWRAGYEGRDQPTWAVSEKEAKKRQEGLDIDPNVDTYAERVGTDPDEWIEITHGGGEWSILEFLKGESEGYPLERGGVGLQVSPKEDATVNRSYNDYAPKATAFFDKPAVLSAKIQAKYLKAAPNGYEAGLPSKSLGHLKDIEVKVISTGVLHRKTEEGWKEYSREHFNDPELGKEIFKSQEKS